MLFKQIKISYIHNLIVTIFTLIIVIATLFGSLQGLGMKYLITYLMRMGGLYCFVYCFFCFLNGEENFISAGWLITKKFTKRNYPLTFYYVLVMLLVFGLLMSYIGFYLIEI